MRFDVHPTTMKQKQGASTRTHPAKIHIRQRYEKQSVPHWERSVFLYWWYNEPVLPAMRQARFREHVTFGSLQENTVKTLAKRERTGRCQPF